MTMFSPAQIAQVDEGVMVARETIDGLVEALRDDLTRSDFADAIAAATVVIHETFGHATCSMLVAILIADKAKETPCSSSS